MAWSKQAEKRNRQNEKRRLQNRTIKGAMRTHIKKVNELLEEKETPSETVLKQISVVASHADKAAKKHVIHKNKASRIKSRLTKALNRAKQQS
jgi:small subunit ribosomal protein S20